MTDQIYNEIGYGDRTIGFGQRPGIVVIDFQVAFTDKDGRFSTDLVQRAVNNTSRVLDVARSAGVPIANCYTAYHSERDMPHWKIGPVHEDFYYGHPCTAMEPRTTDDNYDFVFCKSAPSFLLATPIHGRWTCV